MLVATQMRVASSTVPRASLAQYVGSGIFEGEFSAGGEPRVAEVIRLCDEIHDPEFVAKCAIHGHRSGSFSAVPVLLVAYVGTHGRPELVASVLKRVIDSARMLSLLVQFLRSGSLGQHTIPHRLRRPIQRWFESRTHTQILRESLDASFNPTILDLLRLLKPKPVSAHQAALFNYLLSVPYDVQDLPEVAQEYEFYRRGQRELPPDRLNCSARGMSKKALGAYALIADWNWLLPNLGALFAQGLFTDSDFVRRIANRLTLVEKTDIAGPFKLLLYNSLLRSAPLEIRVALQAAMDTTIDDVLKTEGKIFVFPDLDVSMMHATMFGTLSYLDVAALISLAALRGNELAKVVPFSGHDLGIDKGWTTATVMTRFSEHLYGGPASVDRTSSQADAFQYLDRQERVDGAVLISNKELTDFSIGKHENAKFVYINLVPRGRKPSSKNSRLLRVEDFSDSVFGAIGTFLGPERDFLNEIEAIQL